MDKRIMTEPKAPLERRLRDLPLMDGEPDRDEILNRFLAYVSDDLDIELYPAQEEAFLALLDWQHVVLNTPTGSGKSLVAMALHFQAMAEDRISYYTCPIKALVNEKFFDLCDTFGPENVGLMTGDAAVNTDAPIICCTAEILANRALRDENLAVDYVVVDEFHFYGDKERGSAWQIPLITMKNTVFLLMSATLGDMSHIVSKLKAFTNRDVTAVSSVERPVPLSFQYRDTPIHETVTDLLAADEAPVYIVSFTQRGCAEQAQALTSINVCSKENRRAIQEEIKAVRFDTPYGKEIRRFLSAGVGIHHAGLLPKYRLLVERLAQSGLLKVICGTDSLGVGVNVPIRAVVFRALSKWDGAETRLLSARQFHQIAGRAGRKGFDDHGLVVVQAPEHIIENKRIDQKIAKNPNLKKKLRKRTPPERGFVHWDQSVFERLVAALPEPLEPRFSVSHGMLVNVLLSRGDVQGGGYRRLMEIIRRAHISEAQKKAERKQAASLFRALRRAGIVEIIKNSDRPGATMQVREGLQYNFSLNQALSLYLVDTLELLDPESEALALDMLTLVESILENPNVILFRQVDRIKDELVARLKADGVPYEERMEKLEQVEHPKPLKDFIYSTFNEFSRYHPWAGGENIKPKSIVREMFEKCMSFNDYVRELGIARSEGVLLRYMSQAFKTSIQNVPESFWNESFEEIHSFLSTGIRQTDSSLIDEWEQMMSDDHTVPIRHGHPEESAPSAPPPLDLAKDMKKLSARIRNELYLFQRALADRDYEQALVRILQNEDTSWTPEAIRKAIEPFFELYDSIDLTPRARRPDGTLIREIAPRRFEVAQKIIASGGEDEFAVMGFVDLTESENPEGPIVALDRIGY
jgi:superfamily II RNA helicase